MVNSAFISSGTEGPVFAAPRPPPPPPRPPPPPTPPRPAPPPYPPRHEQMFYSIRRRAIAVFQLRADVIQCRLVCRAGNALVHPQPLVLLRDIVRIDAHRNAQVQHRRRMRRPFVLALQRAHRLL